MAPSTQNPGKPAWINFAKTHQQKYGYRPTWLPDGKHDTLWFMKPLLLCPTASTEGMVIGLPPEAIAAAGISRTFQLPNSFPRLSVYENIRAGVITKSLERRKEEEKIKDMLELLRISHLADTHISEIPPVARKLVEVGRALIADPQLVLFDEIMAGFNEEEMVNLIELIRRENQKGITFCIIGHTMRAIMDVSDWVVVLDEGSKFLEGTPKEIQENSGVQRIYLGE